MITDLNFFQLFLVMVLQHHLLGHLAVGKEIKKVEIYKQEQRKERQKNNEYDKSYPRSNTRPGMGILQ